MGEFLYNPEWESLWLKIQSSTTTTTTTTNKFNYLRIKSLSMAESFTSKSNDTLGKISAIYYKQRIYLPNL